MKSERRVLDETFQQHEIFPKSPVFLLSQWSNKNQSWMKKKKTINVTAVSEPHHPGSSEMCQCVTIDSPVCSSNHRHRLSPFCFHLPRWKIQRQIWGSRHTEGRRFSTRDGSHRLIHCWEFVLSHWGWTTIIQCFIRRRCSCVFTYVLCPTYVFTFNTFF